MCLRRRCCPGRELAPSGSVRVEVDKSPLCSRLLNSILTIIADVTSCCFLWMGMALLLSDEPTTALLKGFSVGFPSMALGCLPCLWGHGATLGPLLAMGCSRLDTSRVQGDRPGAPPRQFRRPRDLPQAQGTVGSLTMIDLIAVDDEVIWVSTKAIHASGATMTRPPSSPRGDFPHSIRKPALQFFLS